MRNQSGQPAGTHDLNARAQAIFWLVILIFLVLFEVAVRSKILSPAAFASPSEMIHALYRLVKHEDFARDISATLIRSLAGFAIGFVGGFVSACLLLSFGRARASGELVLDFLRSIPITALVPLFLVVFGIGEANKIALGATAALFTSALTIWIGLRKAETRRKTLLHLYRPAPWRSLWFVILPEALASIVTAARLALSTALVLVVVAEMFIGTQRGVGHVINDKSYGDDRPGQYAAVFAAGIIGYLLNAVLSWIERNLDPATKGGRGMS